jgi:hypothetical protein
MGNTGEDFAWLANYPVACKRFVEMVSCGKAVQFADSSLKEVTKRYGSLDQLVSLTDREAVEIEVFILLERAEEKAAAYQLCLDNFNAGPVVEAGLREGIFYSQSEAEIQVELNLVQQRIWLDTIKRQHKVIRMWHEGNKATREYWYRLRTGRHTRAPSKK